jgi:hypothetical protein
LPDPAVDALAQQVGVPAMAGVLLDSVNPQLPDGDTLPAHPRAQVRVPGQHRIGCRLFTGKVSDYAPTARSRSAAGVPALRRTSTLAMMSLPERKSAQDAWEDHEAEEHP